MDLMHRMIAIGRTGLSGRLGRLALAALYVTLAACERRERPTRSPGEIAAEDRASASIDPDQVSARIAVLSHDTMGGRATPSPGLDLAARYVASEFAAMGLEPGGDDGGFLQWYAIQQGDSAARAPNAVGILRGADGALRDSWVVYSAHMDHIGSGEPDADGDSIYNGADDDASGTAAILEIAEAFARLPEPPARSVAFVATSGEESGLYGSRAFLDHGPIPANRMIANINIDMIGRNAPDTVVAIGMQYSDLGDRIRAVAARHPGLGLTVADDPWPEEQFFFRSDHYNFALAGVPALFLFAGVHEDYHRPSDEVDRIDSGKATRIARLAFRLGLDVARDLTIPSWTREGLRVVRPDGVR